MAKSRVGRCEHLAQSKIAGNLRKDTQKAHDQTIIESVFTLVLSASQPNSVGLRCARGRGVSCAVDGRGLWYAAGADAVSFRVRKRGVACLAGFILQHLLVYYYYG